MAIVVKRLEKIVVFFVILLVLLLGRLGELQLIEGAELALEGMQGRVQEILAAKTRGEILDRNHQRLTNEETLYQIFVFPLAKPMESMIREKLAGVLSEPELVEVLQLARGKQPGRTSFRVSEAVGDLINHSFNLPGFIAVKENLRYNQENFASHVIGYANSDNHGVTGIEALYDSLLTSQQEKYVAALLDGSAQVIPGLGYKAVNAGGGSEPKQIVLTIDKEVQRQVETIVDQHMERGAVVVMKAKTGEIVSLVSRPNFSGNDVGKSLQQARSPLMNRAVTAYQPGSVFKLVVAAAAIDLGMITPETVFYDPGYIDIDKIRFRGWDYEKGPRGLISFQDALAFSSNPVFIAVGQKLGAQRLLSYADKLGFGHKTNLNFVDEATGNLPLVETVFAGDLANLSIGQGTCEVTPLQMASLIGTIVNDGVFVEPYLVSEILAANGRLLQETSITPEKRVLQAETARKLRRMMAAVTSYGTGQAADIPLYGAAGKTGSAETGRMDKQGAGINHAWFAGYTPLEKPEFAIVVFVEDGHSGGDVAAPLFSKIAAALVNGAQSDKNILAK